MVSSTKEQNLASIRYQPSDRRPRQHGSPLAIGKSKSATSRRQTTIRHPRSQSRQPRNPGEKSRRPPSDEKLNVFAEAAPTICSRSHHGQLVRSIRVGPTLHDQAGPKDASNPESTPPPSTTAPLGADFGFFRRSRTPRATTTRFRPTSPPRHQL